jgi:hypothetical protein
MHGCDLATATKLASLKRPQTGGLHACNLLFVAVKRPAVAPAQRIGLARASADEIGVRQLDLDAFTAQSWGIGLNLSDRGESDGTDDHSEALHSSFRYDGGLEEGSRLWRKLANCKLSCIRLDQRSARE